MNLVQPIRDKRDINRMKKALGNPRDLLLFTFGINSALRISDILKLKVGDVRNTDVLTREQKTGKIKRFRMNKAIVDAVKSLVPAGATDSDWLFPSRKGDKPITRVQAWRILNDAADRAGVKTEIGTHTLRKTFAYHAYKSGVDLTLLMSVLNHSSQRDTLRYIGIEQDRVDDVYISVNL
ncbi:site-specific integrase [Heyndrickxia oleronia]|uniref:Site-specific integrase n=1 Tax=Heyndrickxia oleronia TaxID=38875 RepID=A0AAW6SSM7_9BACI|nr:site-specific integrase [Heyndrickxia oleronia]MDH5159832.1 site-specific integrase [Heyndrickxia oleronia]